MYPRVPPSVPVFAKRFCFAVALGCRGRYFTTVIAQRLKTEGEDPKVRVAAGA